MKKRKMKGCAHSSFWIMAGATYCWCPDCGSIRRLGDKKWEWGGWLYPQGQEATLRKWTMFIEADRKGLA